MSEVLGDFILENQRTSSEYHSHVRGILKSWVGVLLHDRTDVQSWQDEDVELSRAIENYLFVVVPSW